MRLRRLFGAMGAAGLLAAVGVSAASASISGPCAANIAGAGVAGLSGTDPAAAIHVKKGGLVAVSMSAASPISQLKVQIAFAGFSWTVKNGSAHGSSWTRTLKVDDYATWGVGL